jgi:hypothetical protein
MPSFLKHLRNSCLPRTMNSTHLRLRNPALNRGTSSSCKGGPGPERRCWGVRGHQRKAPLSHWSENASFQFIKSSGLSIWIIKFSARI